MSSIFNHIISGGSDVGDNDDRMKATARRGWKLEKKITEKRFLKRDKNRYRVY